MVELKGTQLNDKVCDLVLSKLFFTEEDELKEIIVDYPYVTLRILTSVGYISEVLFSYEDVEDAVNDAIQEYSEEQETINELYEDWLYTR